MLVEWFFVEILVRDFFPRQIIQDEPQRMVVALQSLAETAHNVHLPCGLTVYNYVLGMYIINTATRSSHPWKCSDFEHFMLLLQGLLCFVLFSTFPPLCVVL